MTTGTLQLLKVASIIEGDRARKDMGNLDELAASIQEQGLIQPIVVRSDMRLVAGARRLAAYTRLNWTDIPAVVTDDYRETLALLKAERDENTCRKDFLPSEAVALGKRLEPSERKAAKERQREGQKSGGRGKKKLGDDSSPSKPATKTRDRTAKAVGMSGQKYERAKEVVAAAKKEPEKYGPLVEQMDRTGNVNGAFKKLQTAKAAEKVQAEPPPLPDGRFRVVVVDPPWSYDNRPDDPTHRAANPYPSMTLDEIKAMPVAERAHEDGCVLWLWTTNAHLRVAFEVAESWGFTYKTLLTWGKDKMGTGDWLRGQTEHCLMCVSGKPVITLTNQTTLLSGPLREHSRKPEEFYALVEALCPGSKLELFQRTPREGWIGHGNDTEKFHAETAG